MRRSEPRHFPEHGRCCAACFHNFLLCRRLHDVAQAPNTAKYRHCGAAGAFPPVIGWVAAAGNVGLEPLILFLIIFLWTPPHFWALSLNLAGDYARAGVPMLPVVAGRAETKRQIVLYSVLLAPISLLPWALGFAGRSMARLRRCSERS